MNMEACFKKDIAGIQSTFLCHSVKNHLLFLFPWLFIFIRPGGNAVAVVFLVLTLPTPGQVPDPVFT